ncbi:unnamed protein product, partial [Musa acuminata var. zebrina]
AWLSSPPFASKYLASHHHQNHHRSDRRPRRGPTATSWGSIFLTPGRLPDPAPLCFAPLVVQNPNTEDDFSSAHTYFGIKQQRKTIFEHSTPNLGHLINLE